MYCSASERVSGITAQKDVEVPELSFLIVVFEFVVVVEFIRI